MDGQLQRPALRPPRWARAADALALAVAVVGVSVALLGGFRLRMAGVRISAMSAPRILAVAFAIMALRLLLCRDTPVWVWAWRSARQTWQSRDLRAVLPAWAVSRAGVLLVGFLAVGAYGFRDNTVPFRLYENELLNLPARYDAGWYLSVAANGYQWDARATGQQNIAFMPALPLLMRSGGRLLGGHPVWAGQIVVLLASLWGFAYVYRLARSALGDPDRAAAAVTLLAAYPFAVFYSAVYTESIFLLTAAGAFYHVGRGEYWWTAAFALLCGFARPNGFLLAVPIALAALWPALVESWGLPALGVGARVGRALRRAAPGLLASCAAVLGVVAFSAFVYSMTGRPLAWLEAHAAWGRTFGFWWSHGPIQVVRENGLYAYVLTQPVDALNFLAALGCLAAIWPVTRRLGLPYGVFIALNLIPPLTTGGTLSIGRVTATMFPMFIWLAGAIPPRRLAAWLIGFALLQGWGAALFYSWREFI